MAPDTFTVLPPMDKLDVIRNNGKMARTFIFLGYEFTLYKVHEFYVELKREVNQFDPDAIVFVTHEFQPMTYTASKPQAASI